MRPNELPLPAPIARGVRLIESQRSLARRVLGADPPGCQHHPVEGSMEENLRRTIAAIERSQAEWVLVGAEAVNLYVEPRATEDFDLVVAGGRFAYVLREMGREFGELEQIDVGAATRFPGIGIDLIRSDAHALFRLALERARVQGPMRVPPPEVVIALKFLSAINPWRKPADRKQDALDLVRIYAERVPELDRAEMMRLASLAYPGAEREFAALLGQIDRGEDLKL